MIVPSIDLMDGQAVQLVQGRERELEAGDPRPIARGFAIAGEIAVVDLDAALGRGDNTQVIRELLRIAPCRVGGGIRSVDAALNWLDAGATRVVLGTAATPEVLSELPPDRVIAALDARDGEVVVDGWREATGASIEERAAELAPFVSGFLITFVEHEGGLGGLPLERARALAESMPDMRITFAGGIREASEIGELDRLGAHAQVGMALYTGALDLADAIAAPLVARPEGASAGGGAEDPLWPTVVTDEGGQVLGLVWSNPESLRTAVRERRGVYWSRRRGLWRKGETSGATQRLERIDLDCDRDALRFVVRQERPGFCHTGAWSCFGPRPAGALGRLERRIARRVAGNDSASLTRRLADDPATLGGKLREEAGELIEAGDRDHATHEAADLLYFALVELARRGVRLSDVEAELDRRARRVRRRAASPPEALKPS